jgi:hypothetical protein
MLKLAVRLWKKPRSRIFQAVVFFAQKLPRRRSDTIDVLFFATNELYLSYFRDLFPALESDKRFRFFLTTPSGKEGMLSEEEQTYFISSLRARLKRWSFVIFSSPLGTELFPRAIKKVLLPHGIGGGKIARGESWRHGRKNTIQNNSLIFTAILESSDLEVSRIENRFPHLIGTVYAVGSPKFDRLLTSRREKTFRSILVQSSYGPGSLVGRVGLEKLVENCRFLAEDRNTPVLLSLHPNYWTGYAGAPILGPSARELTASTNVRVLEPLTPWEAYFSEVTFVISDHTNLILIPFLLRIPTLCASPQAGVLDSDSLVGRIHEFGPQLVLDSPWSRQIDTVMACFDPANGRGLRSSALSYEGQSLERILNLLSDLEGIDRR